MFAILKDNISTQLLSPENNNTKRKITSDCIINFKKKLLEVDWSIVYMSFNATESYDLFIEVFMNIYYECFPIVKRKNRKRTINVIKPWITEGILKSSKRKNRLYALYLKRKTDYYKTKYINYKNKLTTIIRCAKKQYITSVFNSVKGNIANTWKERNKLIGN